MVYATYDYYTEEYYGNLIPDEAFERVITKASRHIDYFTFERIKEGDTEVFPSISSCACEMAEAIYQMQEKNGTGKEKKSESTDGYSVSYVTECVDGELAEDTLKRKLYSIAKTYLISTGLLYLGC